MLNITFLLDFIFSTITTICLVKVQIEDKTIVTFYPDLAPALVVFASLIKARPAWTVKLFMSILLLDKSKHCR